MPWWLWLIAGAGIFLFLNQLFNPPSSDYSFILIFIILILVLLIILLK